MLLPDQSDRVALDQTTVEHLQRTGRRGKAIVVAEDQFATG